MKTITLDYETYEKELKAARVYGSNILKNLPKELEEILHGLNSYDRKAFDEAKARLLKLLNEVS
jgi:hypothetical protein